LWLFTVQLNLVILWFGLVSSGLITGPWQHYSELRPFPIIVIFSELSMLCWQFRVFLSGCLDDGDEKGLRRDGTIRKEIR
jgi:hypothetical protein